MPQFPQDFEQHAHPHLPGVTQYKLYAEDGNRLFSVVTGPKGSGVYANNDTYEMYSDQAEDVVLSYATAEEINEYLNNK